MKEQISSSNPRRKRVSTHTHKTSRKKQCGIERFSQATNTRRNVSKYMNAATAISLIGNRPQMNTSIVLENTVNVLPDDVISWHFERIYALGIGGMRDYVLRTVFDNTPMKHLSSGAFGDVYIVKVTKGFRDALKKIYQNQRTYNKILSSIPRTGSSVVVKVDKIIAETSNTSWNKIPKNTFYESMHDRREETRMYLKRVKSEASRRADFI